MSVAGVDRRALRVALARAFGLAPDAPALAEVDGWDEATASLMAEIIGRLSDAAERRSGAAPALHAAAGEGGSAAGDPSTRKWAEAVERFRAAKPALLADPRYRERHVAMKNGRVVDSDDDEWALLERVNQTHRGESVLIAHVTATPRVVHLPSPKVPHES
jgi:hypothetical protein